MKILVVGLGSIAKRHIRNIKEINPDSKIVVWRQHSRNIDLGDLNNFVEKVFFSQEEALEWKPEVTFITNPASKHCETALIFARRGSHLFIEKPLSVDIEPLDELLAECKKRKLITMVGYMLRFFEPINIIKRAIEKNHIGKILAIKASVGQNLLTWRPDKRYQDTVTAKRELGGGVLSELSHELDYVRWLVGEISSVSVLAGKISSLVIDVEDIAEINIKFESGVFGNIHLDMLDLATNRSCRVIGTKGTIKWDYSVSDNRVMLYSAESNSWRDLYFSENTDRNDMYKQELNHFFGCIKEKKNTLISLEDGKRIVEIISAAKVSAEKGEAISV